jgi:hypothetical protein
MYTLSSQNIQQSDIYTLQEDKTRQKKLFNF